MYIIIHTLILLLVMVPQAFPGAFEGLIPGESCRGEVYDTLGQPVKVRDNYKTCWFDPKPFKGRTIKARFYTSGILRTLLLEPDTPYSRTQYENWLELGEPDRQKKKDGNRYNYYDSKGIALVQEGLEKDTLVSYFWHYHSGITAMKDRWNKLEDSFHEAGQGDDCKGMQVAFRAGQKEFPKIAWFYIDEITWRLQCDPKAKNYTSQLVSLAQKGVDLNPVAESYKFLGYAHVSMTKDPARALAAFNHIDPADDPSIHVYMGGCHQELGNKAAAREHYRLYLKALPDGKLAATAKKALRQLQ